MSYAQTDWRALCEELSELVAWLQCVAEEVRTEDYATIHSPDLPARAADLLERLASPACVVLKPSRELTEAIKDLPPGRIELLFEDAQVIEPTERTILVPARTPVPVSERPWEREGWCDEQGRCWWFNSEDPHWVFDDAMTCRHWADFSLPHNALPLPGSSSTL